MANYDISAAFEVIEDELISSMTRNLKRHRIEEIQQGMEWEQWQVLQLQALEDYRRNNQKKFPPRFNKLNGQIANALHTSYNNGATSQERQILKAIQKGYQPPTQKFNGQIEITGEFFKVNDRRLDALVNATVSDMSKAEYSILRQSDDQYRKIIFNAQVYANTGAGTYEKAVDMATKDFLKAGINSIQYKNGSRHTIEEYSRMALQTAMKRAYLQGEGEMRKEFGVSTVILKKRACACPKCLPFVGKVFIDDVWSGGDKSGISPVTGIKYPLLSQAIALGLYHPNCRDTHTTYFEGISTPPEDSQYTADELDEIAEKYKAEQQQSYCENQADKYHRLSKYSLDSDNKRIYSARAKAWDGKAKKYKNFVETVENRQKYDIIKSKRESESKISMNTDHIDSPIEQRNTGKGNPNAVLMFGVELNNRQKKLLEQLSGFDSKVIVPKKSVKMTDLAALTAYTGDEFAMFTNGNERLIIRGNFRSVNIDVETAKNMAKQGYRWSGHTHPGIDFNCLFSSDGDRAILKQFNQDTSVIYNSKGQFLTFALEE